RPRANLARAVAPTVPSYQLGDRPGRGENAMTSNAVSRPQSVSSNFATLLRRRRAILATAALAVLGITQASYAQANFSWDGDGQTLGSGGPGIFDMADSRIHNGTGFLARPHK